MAVASPIPELAPVTTAIRSLAEFTETTLMNVLNFSRAVQRLVKHDRRVCVRGRCVLLPRTLPRLTHSRCGRRPAIRTQTKDARALDHTHPHPSFVRPQRQTAVAPPDHAVGSAHLRLSGGIRFPGGAVARPCRTRRHRRDHVTEHR